MFLIIDPNILKEEVDIINRRRFLHITCARAVGLLAGGIPSLINILSVGAEVNKEAEFQPDLDIFLAVTSSEVQIYPVNPTWVSDQRRPSRLMNLESSYLRPIIQVNKGEKIRNRFTNDTPDVTIVHRQLLHERPPVH